MSMWVMFASCSASVFRSSKSEAAVEANRWSISRSSSFHGEGCWSAAQNTPSTCPVDERIGTPMMEPISSSWHAAS